MSANGRRRSIISEKRREPARRGTSSTGAKVYKEKVRKIPARKKDQQERKK